MASVVIQCPKTGEWVPTGFDMDQSSFDSSQLIDNGVQCRACGEMHIWNKEDAKLAD